MSASSKKKLRKEQVAAAMTEKQLAQQKEAKKLKIYSITFVAVLALIVVAALVVGSINIVNNSGILQKSTDAVVIGDSVLSNADLNFFYIDQIQNDYNSWYSSYGNSTQLFVQWFMGLDITKPLNQQVYNAETGETFADYYKDMAIENAKEVYAIYNLAKAAGETLTEAQQSELDLTFTSLDSYAALRGYANAEAYLKAIYGAGATAKNYRHYLEVNTIATNYAQNYYNSLEISDADIEARNNESYDEFSSFDYAVFFVDMNAFLPCLSQNVGSDHAHTVAEYAAARKAAEEAANAIVASGATDTDMLDAAIANIEAYQLLSETDRKSGIRTDYTLDKVTEDQAQWLSADGRQVGDLGMLSKKVTTTEEDGQETTTIDGYYIMLFLGRDDHEQNLANIRHILVSFTGGTTDENGNKTYSEEEKKAAKDAIEAIQTEWLAQGGTEEAFIALAKEKTTDTGSKENGGLYEEVYPGQMVQNFNDWCFAEGREAGNYGIVETEFGYHLIYFVSHSDIVYRDTLIEDTLINERYTEWYEGHLEAATVTVKSTKYLSQDYIIAGY